MNHSFLLLLVTFLPLAGMFLVLALPKSSSSMFRWIALGVTVAQLGLSLLLWHAFNPALGGINDASSFQFISKAVWLDLPSTALGNIHIDFFMGVDGLSMPMILLT